MKEYTFSSKIQKFYCYDLSKNWGIIWNSWLVTLKVPNSSYFNFYQMLKSGYIVLNLSNLQGFIKENQMGKKISKLSKDSLVKIFICAMHADLLSCFSYVWLCYPTDCRLPGSSFHRILQGIKLEWVAMLFSRGSSQPRDRPRVSFIAGGFFTIWATRKALFIYAICLCYLWFYEIRNSLEVFQKFTSHLDCLKNGNYIKLLILIPKYYHNKTSQSWNQRWK